jgi:hypothetical protein
MSRQFIITSFTVILFVLVSQIKAQTNNNGTNNNTSVTADYGDYETGDMYNATNANTTTTSTAMVMITTTTTMMSITTATMWSSNGTTMQSTMTTMMSTTHASGVALYPYSFLITLFVSLLLIL